MEKLDDDLVRHDYIGTGETYNTFEYEFINFEKLVVLDGLPNDFEPILAYTHNQHPDGQITSLWNREWGIFFLAPNSNSFQEFTEADKADWNLDGFKAVAGYSHTFDGVDDELLALWDRNGNVKFMRIGETSFTDYDDVFDSDGDGISNREEEALIGFSAILGYTNFLNGPDREVISLWDSDGNVKVMTQGDENFKDYEGVERANNGLEGFNAVEGYYDPIQNTVFLWDINGVLLKWDWDEESFVDVPDSFFSTRDLFGSAPDAAYYDEEKDIAVVWFDGNVYVSDNGENFRAISYA